MTQQKRLLQSALCSTIALALIVFPPEGNAQSGHVPPRYVYLPGGQRSDRVYQYRLDAAGYRHALSPPSVSVHGSAYFVIVAADHRSVYVPETDYMNVAQFHVRSNGTLAPMRHPEIAADSHPSALVFSPNGQNAYVSCSHGDVCQYRIRHDGSLCPLSPATVSIRPHAIHDSGLRDPSPVSFQQNGHRASVLAEWDDGVRAKRVWYCLQYRVRADGALILRRIVNGS